MALTQSNTTAHCNAVPACVRQSELQAALEEAKTATATEASRAAAAAAATEARVREAAAAGETKLLRFQERTAREMEGVRKKMEAETKKVGLGVKEAATPHDLSWPLAAGYTHANISNSAPCPGLSATPP